MRILLLLMYMNQNVYWIFDNQSFEKELIREIKLLNKIFTEKVYRVFHFTTHFYSVCNIAVRRLLPIGTKESFNFGRGELQFPQPIIFCRSSTDPLWCFSHIVKYYLLRQLNFLFSYVGPWYLSGSRQIANSLRVYRVEIRILSLP